MHFGAGRARWRKTPRAGYYERGDSLSPEDISRVAQVGGAYDLSALAKPAEERLPEGVFRCDVEGGCNLTIRANGTGVHEDLRDCIETIFPYVEQYLAMRESVQTLVQEDELLRRQNKSLLMSNMMLAEKIEELKRAGTKDVSTERQERLAAEVEAHESSPVSGAT